MHVIGLTFLRNKGEGEIVKIYICFPSSMQKIDNIELSKILI